MSKEFESLNVPHGMWQAHLLDLGNFQAENFNLRLIRVNIIFPKKKMHRAK